VKERRLMKGNEAFAEAAISAGCRCYFGYPITPQNEITEYMSREMPKVGGVFVQAESELAAISMAYGAAASGERTLITSSSPGIALMQEGISFLCSVDVPLVLVNVSRGGPGVGGIQPGQADYFQATRGGGNGDYHVIVFAPASIQEAVDKIGQAYEIAEKYRNPVMLLVDGMLGQMMEPVSIPDRVSDQYIADAREKKGWAITGHKNNREKNVIKSLRLRQDDLEASIEERDKKYARAEKMLVEYEENNLADAKVVFVAFGSTSRIVKDAMFQLNESGVKSGMIRPVSIWPFPYKAFDSLSDKTQLVVSVELSKGQLIQDVRLGVQGRKPVELIYRTGGSLLTPEEVVCKAKRMLEVE